MKRYCVILTTLLLILVPSMAQDDAEITSPFIRMLEQAPLTEETTTSFIYYSDLRIAATARPGLPPVTSYADVFALGGGSVPPLFLMALPDNLSILPFMRFILSATPDEFIATNGFDLLAIDQTLLVDSLPDQLMLLAGNFDSEAVTQALANKDYVVENEAPLVLCPDTGCNMGNQADFANRDTAFVFGGELGRRFPVLVSEQSIAASPSLPMFMRVRALAEGRGFNLMDAPQFALIANYLATNEILVRQVTLVLAITIDFDATLMEGFFNEEKQALIENLDFGTFPHPEVFALVDASTPSAEETLIIMTYPDTETATIALEELLARYDIVPSLVDEDVLIQDMIEARNASLINSDVVEQDEQALVILTFSNPHPANTPGDDGRIARSGGVFNLLQSMIFRRDMLWFVSSTEME